MQDMRFGMNMASWETDTTTAAVKVLVKYLLSSLPETTRTTAKECYLTTGSGCRTLQMSQIRCLTWSTKAHTSCSSILTGYLGLKQSSIESIFLGKGRCW